MKKLISLYKNLNKPLQIVIKVFLIIILLVPTITLSRYIYKLALDQYYKTKDFYFKSDLLTKDGAEYTISNWSGVDDYILTINMSSILNELVASESDITYDIKVECDDTIICELSKTSGLIPSEALDNSKSNRDFFNITVIPKQAFDNNESAKIKVTTNSTSPYKATLSALFNLKVERVGLSYEITDKKNDIFAVLRLTNSITYYTVDEAFLNYSVGDLIESKVYNSLSDENKKKCSSMIVEMSFDPSVVRLDMTNTYFLDAYENGDFTTVSLREVKSDFGDYKEGDLITNSVYNGLSNNDKNKVSVLYDYVNGFKITLDPVSSADIIFYKRDKLKDYSYPNKEDSSIITVK